MPKLTIDGEIVEAPEGMTVYQAAQLLGREIPVFCYHERLDIAGNCRMCLVDVEGAPKPVASCAMPAADGMVVHTRGAKVQKAREGVLEFLLMHHPLDCPICDQGGECDLQDIAMAYGRGESRYEEAKRAVPPKQMGPIVKTFMTRCIHCTRCVRFADRVAGDYELGAVSRGENTEITTYIDSAIRSELSGNLVDLCPVGALTSAPYAFRGRPWDLKRVNSVDVMDAMGANISVHTYGREIKRIQPRTHEGINEEWLSDKARFAFDGLRLQRLDRPYVRDTAGRLVPSDFKTAFAKISGALAGASRGRLAVAAGPFCNVESMFLLKKLLSRWDNAQFVTGAGMRHIPASARAQYLFNTSFADICRADCVLLVGANVRRDAPLVHTRLRQHYLDTGVPIGYIGGLLDGDRGLNFDYTMLGHDAAAMHALVDTKSKISFVQHLHRAQRPMVIIGDDLLVRDDAAGYLAQLEVLARDVAFVQDDWDGFNFLHTDASSVGALDLGYRGRDDSRGALEDQLQRGVIDFLYLFGEDRLGLERAENMPFTVYHGHHGDAGASCADVVLPGAAYTEQNGLYTNMEGRVQEAFTALAPPGDAREDWRIIRALSDYLEGPLAHASLAEVRADLCANHPVYTTRDVVRPESWQPFDTAADMTQAVFKDSPFVFYQTDVISKNSRVMAQCQRELISTGIETQVPRTDIG